MYKCTSGHVQFTHFFFFKTKNDEQKKIFLFNSLDFRTMSSKRKSPPTKLEGGVNTSTSSSVSTTSSSSSSILKTDSTNKTVHYIASSPSHFYLQSHTPSPESGLNTKSQQSNSPLKSTVVPEKNSLNSDKIPDPSSLSSQIVYTDLLSTTNEIDTNNENNDINPVTDCNKYDDDTNIDCTLSPSVNSENFDSETETEFSNYIVQSNYENLDNKRNLNDRGEEEVDEEITTIEDSVKEGENLKINCELASESDKYKHEHDYNFNHDNQDNLKISDCEGPCKKQRLNSDDEMQTNFNVS